jgi:F-type H+-transporting ATPase subunit epsilon
MPYHPLRGRVHRVAHWSIALANSFRCRLVTPTAALVDDQVKYASVPAWDGLFGVQPGRAALLARLGTGELRLDYADSGKAPGGSRTFVLDGGFVKMAGDELTILAESAVAAETLTPTDAEAELKAAKTPHAVNLAKLKVKVAASKGGI